MCNQRDRLIGFVYNECDAHERDEVQKHLDTCAECQVEIAGLRSVRDDLLAWDVPAHESVWKPFAPAPMKAVWRQVPAWALAAAAAIVMLSGAAGGAVLQAFWPGQERVRTTASTAPQPVTTLTAADLSATEKRLVAMMQDELGAVDARVKRVSLQMPVENLATATHDELVEKLIAQQLLNKELVEMVKSVNANIDRFRSEGDFKIGNLEGTVRNLQSLVLALQAQVK